MHLVGRPLARVREEVRKKMPKKHRKTEKAPTLQVGAFVSCPGQLLTLLVMWLLMH